MSVLSKASLQLPTRFPWYAIPVACLAVGIALGAGGLYLARARSWAGVAAQSRADEHAGHAHGKGGKEAGHDEHEGEEGVVHLSPDKLKSAGIEVAPVKQKTMEVVTWFTGKVGTNQDRLAHVSSRVTGIAREAPARLGQAVEAGDVLAVLDSTDVGNAKLDFLEKELSAQFAKVNYDWTDTTYRNTKALIEALDKETPIAELDRMFAGKLIGEYREQLVISYARLGQARADLARTNELADKAIKSEADRLKAKADFEAAQATFRAWTEQLRFTSEREHLKTEQELRKAEIARKVARERLFILGFRQADVEAMTAESDESKPQEQMALYPIRAPFAGTIIEKHVVLSEQIEPESKLFSIADLSSVWVDVDIYEKDFDLLPQVRDINGGHSHREVTLHSDSYPDREFKGEAFYTGDVVDEATRTIRLKVEAKNADRALKPGMFVRVGLTGRHLDEALQVPASAVQTHEGKSFVFVQKEPGEFERRDVVVGHSSNSDVEIREGLKADEQVVVVGGFALKSEMMRSKLAEGGHHH